MSLLALNGRVTQICGQTLAACWSTYRQLRDPYRPELHYMRGPGPKWRERYVVLVGVNGSAPRSSA